MKNIKYLIILFAAIIFTGCEEVVKVNLNTAPPRLVIDASINWVKGTDGSLQKIKLTTTTGFYQSIVPVVSNAAVTVTDSNNNVFEFIEMPQTGEYVCNNFIPVIGETYSLKVISGGQTYVATEKMIASPYIENVEQNVEGGITGDLVEIKFYFQDNSLENNFYMTAVETSNTVFPDYNVYDDHFTQGNQNFGLYMSEDLQQGDEMMLSLFGISQQYMNYMNILLQISDGEGGPWQTQPTNVRGNIINQTDFKNFALGYFRLSEVDKMQYTVQ